MPRKGEEKVIESLREGTIMSAREFEFMGITRDALGALVKRGVITSPAHGLFQSSASGYVQFEQFAVIGKRHPEAVVILTSAAGFHGITQNNPPEISVGVPSSKRGSLVFGLQFPVVDVLRWRRPADLTVGVETHRIRGIDVRITSPARTVVDLWRYSTFNPAAGSYARVDEETVLDSLTKYLDRPDGSVGEISEVAETLGVADRMSDLIKGIGYTVGMRA